PGTAPVVLVHDLRQALAWLCGRTAGVTICATERRSLGIPIGDTPQVLADRGPIPTQALEQARVTIIFGPAHPLGARDVGIPCSELVYTRCCVWELRDFLVGQWRSKGSAFTLAAPTEPLRSRT